MDTQSQLQLSYFKGADQPPLLDATIGDYLDDIAARFPHRQALVARHQGVRWTYGEYLCEIEKLARGLLALGIRPGAVSPFGLINDPDHRVQPILDAQMLDVDPINAHPLHNEATTTLSAADFKRFFEITGHAPLIIDFDALEELERARTAA